MKLCLLLLAGACCLHICLPLPSPVELDKRIQDGLKAGDTLLNGLESPETAQTVIPVMAQLAIPFLTALAGLIQGARENSNAKTKQELIDSLLKYNDRLRVMSHEYSQVRDLVDWSTMSLSFGQYERSIVALKENMLQVLQAPESSQQAQKLYFLRVFSNDYNNAATKLYQGMVNGDRLFSDNLLWAVRKYTRNHRKLTRQFAAGVSKLIMEGIELEASYLIYSNITTNMDYFKMNWETKLNKLSEEIQKHDSDILEKWQEQADEDINTFNQLNPPAELKEYAENLYELLKSKFDWREWMVLTYDPVSTYDNHANLDCPQTFIRYRHNGKNVIVSSVDKLKSKFSRSAAEALAKRLPSSISTFQRNKPLYLLEIMLNGISPNDKEDLICKDDTFAFVGVMVAKANHYLATSGDHELFLIHKAKAILTYSFKVLIFG